MAYPILFSARHKNHLEWPPGRKPSFASPAKVAMERILRKHSDHGADWDEVNLTYRSAEEMLCTFYGKDQLDYKDIDSKQVVACPFAEFIRNTCPGQVLDSLEAWFACSPADAPKAEAELNQALRRFESPWRIFGGRAYLLDSVFLEEDLAGGVVRLSQLTGASGPLQEYRQAMDDLADGDTKACVVNAHKALESTLKVLVGSERAKYGELIEQAIRREVVPEYYQGFYTHLRELLLCAAKTRNSPGGGHGQGKDPREMPYELARLNLHLAGALLVFLLESHRSIASSEVAAADGRGSIDDEAIPF